MKIALYRNIEHKFDTVMEAQSGDRMDSYARISEYIDAEFTMLDGLDTHEIIAIKRMIVETEKKTEEKLHHLKERLHELNTK